MLQASRGRTAAKYSLCMSSTQTQADDAYHRLLDAVRNHALFEMKHKPEAYFDYESGKELRYCEPLRWGEIGESRRKAWMYWADKNLLNSNTAFATALSSRKALAIAFARIGGNVEEDFPGLLQEAVQNGWMGFLQELSESYRAPLFQPEKIPWELFLALFWTTANWSGKLKQLWPFCFWTDEALIDFLQGFKWPEVTLDKLRKFRREYGLMRPDSLVVRRFENSRDGKSFRPVFGRRTVPRMSKAGGKSAKKDKKGGGKT